MGWMTPTTTMRPEPTKRDKLERKVIEAAKALRPRIERLAELVSELAWLEQNEEDVVAAFVKAVDDLLAAEGER